MHGLNKAMKYIKVFDFEHSIFPSENEAVTGLVKILIPV
jgi:hypothetical protein